MVLGEARTSLGDLMHVKTELYLHNGIAYKPHIDMTELASSGEVSASGDPGHEGEAAGVQTVIRTAADDFRGFIGYLERQVKPYRDPSEGDTHTAGTEILPWYRLITLSDPHNIRAYLIGAWWLKTEEGRAPREAVKFLDEGIRFNPEAFQLHLTKGYIVQREFGELERALELFEKAAQLAVKARPADPKAREGDWDEFYDEDARGAARMAVLLEKEIGDRHRALSWAIYYNRQLDGDPILERQIEILEKDQAAPALVPHR